MIELFKEKFKDFPLEEFPYDKEHTALGEYHHLMPKGYTGNFYDPINNHQWRSMGGSWIVTNIDGKNYMEQNRGYNVSGHFSDVASILVQKKHRVTNFKVSFSMLLYATKHLSGIAFCYVHSRKYLAFVLEDGYARLYFKNQKEQIILNEVPFSYVDNQEYHIVISKEEDEIKVFIEDNLILEAKTMYSSRGYIALISQNACRYGYLKLEISEEAYDHYLALVKDDEVRLKNKQSKHAPMVCVKKINLKDFGSGRQIRFGRNKDKRFIVMAQHQKRMYRDAFAGISCLTAFDLDGNVMWQKGVANNSPDNTLISCDLPFQVADINNDGIDEVIYAKEFKIYIINAITGEELVSFPTQLVKNDPLFKDYPYDRLNVDAIRVADFTNKGYQGDFIIKDRYANVFAYDSNFNLLFRYNHKNTGHFPYIYDFDGDGKDEMYVGYDMVKDGEVVWSLPFNSDHTDEIIYEALDEKQEKVLILASGNEGLNVCDKNGKVLHSISVGHAQRISLAKYDKNIKGYQLCVTSFWGANGIIYTFDKDLRLIAEKEFIGNGNVITPVNYDNSKEALILSNASCEYGGLLDIDLDVVVPFLDDGHPTLATEVIDIDDDGIDEIITWDQESMWIYKASRYHGDKKQFRKYPDNACSNYRGEYLIEVKEG